MSYIIKSLYYIKQDRDLKQRDKIYYNNLHEEVFRIMIKSINEHDNVSIVIGIFSILVGVLFPLVGTTVGIVGLLVAIKGGSILNKKKRKIGIILNLLGISTILLVVFSLNLQFL
ncbi:hypothetical protein Amet_2476 [Alkaliphilus metalliredigens QYMF]|uniref:DUF4190 domain-containing protein n=2 Tax=Alkaliphilus TaxID=114627 RepID=A6TR12_ALKMQ|nr:hypothetical protein Amet_2476 [Alkaliphilus metalliredigens QYMF]